MDKWELIQEKSDGKFVKDLADVFWDKAVLKRRCLQESRANKKNCTEDEFRKELTPKKYNLLKGKLLYIMY